MTFKEVKDLEKSTWKYKLIHYENDLIGKTIAKIDHYWVGCFNSVCKQVFFFTDNTIAIYNNNINSFESDSISLINHNYLTTYDEKPYAFVNEEGREWIKLGLVNEEKLLKVCDAYVEYEIENHKSRVSQEIDQKLEEIKKLKNKLL